MSSGSPRLLAVEPDLASCVVRNETGGGRTPLHHETPLHWAASNDDLALIDALLDAGADLERGGSSIDGGPALSSAVAPQNGECWSRRPP